MITSHEQIHHAALVITRDSKCSAFVMLITKALELLSRNIDFAFYHYVAQSSLPHELPL